MQTSVLILGSKGMLGQELVRVFSSDPNISVTAWDKEDVDVSNEKRYTTLITELWPDSIINAIAYNAVDACEESSEESEKAYYLNATFPARLASLANNLQANLVHYSTDYVFDGKRPTHRSSQNPPPGCCGKGCPDCSYKGEGNTFDGYREEDQPKPLSVYGKTKYEGEKGVEKNAHRFYVIRLARLFGAPALSQGGKRSFFEVILEKAKNNGKLPVVDDEIGNFTYAPDLAVATKYLLDSSAEYGIYHCVNENPVSWYQAAQTLFHLAGVSVELNPVSASSFPRSAQRASYSALINTKIKLLRSYEEALVDFLQKQ